MTRPTRSGAGGRAYLDLQNRARREGRPTQELLVLYALERFLARLAGSPHAGAFVLKGGMLLAAFDARRATVDADLLAAGFPNGEEPTLARIREVAGSTLADDDGVCFLPNTARARAIRDDSTYSGVRITMRAAIATANVKIQLDVSFGDPMTPAPELIEYPTLREEHPPVRILGYPIVTVIAEKLCTAIDLGEANTRVRDYADIWLLTSRHDFDAAALRDALAATARYRGVTLRPLSDAVGDLAVVRANTYRAFLNRIGDDVSTLPPDLDTVVADVITFADPLTDNGFVGTWSAVHRQWTPAVV